MNNKIIDLDALTEFSNKTKEYIGNVVRYLGKTDDYNDSSKALDVTNWQVGDRYVLKFGSNDKTIYFKYQNKTYSVELCPADSSIVNGEFYITSRYNSSYGGIQVSIVCGISVDGHLFHHFCNVYPGNSSITDGMNVPFKIKWSGNIITQGSEHLVYTGTYTTDSNIESKIMDYLFKLDYMTNLKEDCMYIYYNVDGGDVKLKQVSKTNTTLVMEGYYTPILGTATEVYPNKKVTLTFTYTRSNPSSGLIAYTITNINKVIETVDYTYKVDLPEYDSSSTYSIGDYVIYSNAIYKCNTAISIAEDWDSTHWTSKTYIDYLRDTLNETITGEPSENETDPIDTPPDENESGNI